MAKLTKTQEWLIVASFGLLLLVGIGATYYYLTMEKEATESIEVTSTEIAGESDLFEAEKELKELEDMDLSELDAIEKDLDSINLEEL